MIPTAASSKREPGTPIRALPQPSQGPLLRGRQGDAAGVGHRFSAIGMRIHCEYMKGRHVGPPEARHLAGSWGLARQLHRQDSDAELLQRILGGGLGGLDTSAMVLVRAGADSWRSAAGGPVAERNSVLTVLLTQFQAHTAMSTGRLK